MSLYWLKSLSLYWLESMSLYQLESMPLYGTGYSPCHCTGARKGRGLLATKLHCYDGRGCYTSLNCQSWGGVTCHCTGQEGALGALVTEVARGHPRRTGQDVGSGHLSLNQPGMEHLSLDWLGRGYLSLDWIAGGVALSLDWLGGGHLSLTGQKADTCNRNGGKRGTVTEISWWQGTRGLEAEHFPLDCCMTGHL